jgi:hypothetical protein
MILVNDDTFDGVSMGWSPACAKPGLRSVQIGGNLPRDLYQDSSLAAVSNCLILGIHADGFVNLSFINCLE